MTRDDPKVRNDLIDLILGERIGYEGISRTCYVLRTDERYVVKLENAEGQYFSNVREWNVWHAADGLPWARKWLAQPKWISENGRVLIMERTTPFAESKGYPCKLPYWLTDFKPENFGWGCISGNFVCHDYASDMLINHGFSKRMKKVSWRFKEINK